jgi:N-acetylglucosaminyldiphosphoundecaprenol N-acetyl-beta-D-mannosaminyltransferase
LRIAGAMSPPFRPLSPAEDAAVVDAINASGAGTVWVSLGCPKQELWMQAHRGRVQAVMLGVGAAFDYHAGTIRRAPAWAQHAGLEWLHRLLTEPQRLWRRYLVTNTLFVLAAARQLLLR